MDFIRGTSLLFVLSLLLVKQSIQVNSKYQLLSVVKIGCIQFLTIHYRINKFDWKQGYIIAENIFISNYVSHYL